MAKNKNSNWMVLIAILIALGPLGLMVFVEKGRRDAEHKQTMTYRERFHNAVVKEIEIPDVSEGEVALTRNLYVIFDGSASMREPMGDHCSSDQNFSNKHRGAQWAVEEFVKQVPEGVNLGLYVFDAADSSERLPLQPDREAFMEQIRAVDPGRGTPLAQAIRTGTNALVAQYRKQLGYGEYRLVIVTDGEADELDSAALYATGLGIPLYTIGLCVAPNHVLREYSVSYRAADDFESLKAGLTESLAELPDFDDVSF